MRGNLLRHCLLRPWLLVLFGLQRYCPRYHRAPKRQARLACRKTTFKHRVCASPGGHHHNCSESTPDKLSEERRVESAVCTDLPTAGPEVCRAQVLWDFRVRSHVFNEPGLRCHDFPILFGVEHAPPRDRQILCATAAVETKQEELPHLAKRFLTATNFQSSLPN